LLHGELISTAKGIENKRPRELIQGGSHVAAEKRLEEGAEHNELYSQNTHYQIITKTQDEKEANAFIGKSIYKTTINNTASTKKITSPTKDDIDSQEAKNGDLAKHEGVKEEEMLQGMQNEIAKKNVEMTKLKCIVEEKSAHLSAMLAEMNMTNEKLKAAEEGKMVAEEGLQAAKSRLFNSRKASLALMNRMALDKEVAKDALAKEKSAFLQAKMATEEALNKEKIAKEALAIEKRAWLGMKMSADAKSTRASREKDLLIRTMGNSAKIGEAKRVMLGTEKVELNVEKGALMKDMLKAKQDSAESKASKKQTEEDLLDDWVMITL
jgi:hypothetical protein